MKIDSDFRERVKRHEEESRDSGKSVHLNRVVTTSVDGFRARAKARGFEFFSDEPSEGGGENSAPRPLEYFLAGFAFCEQAQYAKYAALRNLEITGLKMDVRGYVDQRGILGMDDVPAGFQRIEYIVKIESPETPETIRNLAETVESICPAHATISGNAPIQRTLLLNGEEVSVD